MDVSHHVGETKEGKAFETYIGKEEFEKALTSGYDAFLHEVFSMFPMIFH